MSEEQTHAEADSTTAVEEQPFDYPIRVEDAGPATKKVHIEIPQERITSKLEESFKELRQQSAIPGFRVGHAPQKLIEKRFSQDVKTGPPAAHQRELRAAVGRTTSSHRRAHSTRPEMSCRKTAFSYTFEIEVQPDITVPSSRHQIKPKIEVRTRTSSRP
jgi:trigger factor